MNVNGERRGRRRRLAAFPWRIEREREGGVALEEKMAVVAPLYRLNSEGERSNERGVGGGQEVRSTECDGKSVTATWVSTCRDDK